MQLWQRLTARWQSLVFGALPIPVEVRVYRLIEEVFELAQAEGVGEEAINALVRQVYDKPPGEAAQELGGVIICLVAYAAQRGLDVEEAYWTEFERLMDPRMIEKVRRRNLAGDKIGLTQFGGLLESLGS